MFAYLKGFPSENELLVSSVCYYYLSLQAENKTTILTDD